MKRGNVRFVLEAHMQQFRHDPIQVDHTVGKHYIQMVPQNGKSLDKICRWASTKKIRAAHAKEKQRI